MAAYKYKWLFFLLLLGGGLGALATALPGLRAPLSLGLAGLATLAALG